MSTPLHSPTPWKQTNDGDRFYIEDANDRFVCSFLGSECLSTVDHIIACVNAVAAVGGDPEIIHRMMELLIVLGDAHVPRFSRWAGTLVTEAYGTQRIDAGHARKKGPQ